MKTRDEIIKGLETQYMNEYSNNCYPLEFKAQASMTQCNFGGLLIILSNTGESALCWSDWSDNAISETLTECEIEYRQEEDSEEEDLQPMFNFQNTWYSLNNFMKI